MESKFQGKMQIGRILMIMGGAIIFFSSVLFSVKILDEDLIVPFVLSGAIMEIAGVFFAMLESS